MSYSRHIDKTVKLVQKILYGYDYNLYIELHSIKIEVHTNYLDQTSDILHNQLKPYYLFSCIDYSEKKLKFFIRSFI
jgi:hypothetical protein